MRATIVPSLFYFCATTLALPAAGQEAPPFEGEEQVTAVDVVMDLPGGAPGWLPGRRVPRPAGLAGTVDGVEVPVVAVAPPADALDRLVIYVDSALSDDYQLTWSMLLLADRAASLVERGPVEVVVAAPEPVTVLSPTRDAEALEEALARLAFLGAAQDRLVELRLEEALTDESERTLVRDRIDSLLLALVDRSDGPEPRRAALLVSGGFELDADPGLEIAVEEVGRTLAAYGWRLVPLLAPEQAGPIPGVRIGKWRLVGLGAESEGHLWLPPFGAVREEDRDPELAEAHLELAAALRREGELERAADEAETALHHFAGDPRTADRQAAALVLVGELQQRLGDPQRARRAFRRAARFDPAAVAGHPVTEAVPEDAETALAALASAGGGVPARSEGGLDRSLAELGRRAVVTVQMPGTVEGGVRRVEVTRKGAAEPAASGWLRYGTPPEVTEARARGE